MSPSTLLWLAFGLWFVQQVNDLVNAYNNRANVPGMFWVSAGASVLSGLFLFAFLNKILFVVAVLSNAVFN